MSGFVKLSSSIVLSTVWREPHPTRIVWVTMLALANPRGYVGASIPGLADVARVTLAECEEALTCFLAPDPYSRSSEHDGRRIEVVDGGWRLLNYDAYRAGRDPEARREQNREAQARWRERQQHKPGVSQSNPESAQEEDRRQIADPEEEYKQDPPPLEFDQAAPAAPRVSSLRERFDVFWNAYPLKRAKGAALKAWEKLKPGPDLTDTMLLALTRQQWSDPKYIPHPATWLNQQRWLDEDRPAAGPTGRTGAPVNGSKYAGIVQRDKQESSS